MPSDLNDFLQQPGNAHLRDQYVRKQNGLPEPTEDLGLSAADARIIVVVIDSVTGRTVDPLTSAEDFYKEYIFNRQMRPGALGDVFTRLEAANNAGQLFSDNGKLIIGDLPAAEVFERWKTENTHWFYPAGDTNGALAAYGEGRTISAVQNRLKHFNGDVSALVNEAEQWGLTVKVDDNGRMVGGNIFDLRKDENGQLLHAGKPPTGFENPNAPLANGKIDPRQNPIVNLRLPDGSINKQMAKKIDDMRKARGGMRLFNKWCVDAKALGYNLSGYRTK